MKDKGKQSMREAAIAFAVEMKLAKDVRGAAIPPGGNDGEMSPADSEQP